MSKIALITGANRGIGLETARQLAGQGVHVIVAARDAAKAEGAAKALRDAGRAAESLQLDVGDAASIRAAADEVARRHGRLDILVNNAGTTVRIPHDDLEAATPEIFRRLYDVNVVGTWAVTVAAMPHLRATGAGCVINVSSLAGIRPTGSSIPYTASKAALNHLTRLLANVSGPEVRVNAVAPGLVATPWTADWTDLHEGIKHVAPMARSAEPEDIAHVVYSLVDATYVTGEVWAIDGGIALR